MSQTRAKKFKFVLNTFCTNKIGQILKITFFLIFGERNLKPTFYHNVLFLESENATITFNVSPRAVDSVYIKGRASSSPVVTPGAATVNVI